MNVFISHSWAYSEHYEKLAEWIFQDEWYSSGVKIDFYNTSVPKDNPIHFASSDAQLRDAIYDRIKISNVVVIPTGMYTHHSKWIGKEIDGAKIFAKPILAVDPWGQKKSSSVVLSASNDDVGWNKNSVIQGVWRLGRGGI